MTRVIARGIDLVLVFAAADLLVRTGWAAGFLYIMIADGIMEGRSIGKRMLGLRVASRDGMACSVKESALRNAPIAFGYLLFMLPYVGWLLFGAILTLEFILLVGSGGARRLGDELAGTSVIEEIRVQVRKEEGNA